MAVQVAYQRGAHEWARLNYPQWIEWLVGNAEALAARSAKPGATSPSAGLVEALRLIEAHDGLSVGKCAVCGVWGEDGHGKPGAGLMCDCERSSWEPVTPQEIAACALTTPPAGEQERSDG